MIGYCSQQMEHIRGRLWQRFHNSQPSHGGDRKTVEVMNLNLTNRTPCFSSFLVSRLSNRIPIKKTELNSVTGSPLKKRGLIQVITIRIFCLSLLQLFLEHFKDLFPWSWISVYNSSLYTRSLVALVRSFVFLTTCRITFLLSKFLCKISIHDESNKLLLESLYNC